MPSPIEPKRTIAAPRDQLPAIASVTDAPGLHRAGQPNFGPPAAAGEVGTLGPYRVLKELGKGGMGAVYLALDTRLDRKLALKVLLPEFAADRGAKERFLREARTAAKVSHDNVVTVFEADERDGTPYIAMQFLQGYPLDDYLKTRGLPPLPHVVRIGREAALGLAAAHKLGLVHRDIKPANLWLESPNGRVKVLDFGLAKPVNTDAELTKSGAVMGTPAYMSPEQARALKVDHRTDLFSLGVVLYRLCTGNPPFAGEHVLAVLAALVADDPTPVRERNPTVPELLAALIHQLLAKKPEDRPQAAADVANRLRVIFDLLTSGVATDVSASLPVAVRPLPVVVPMQVTARPEDAFANLDARDEDATQAETVEVAPARKSGGRGLLVAVAATVLLAMVAGVVVVAAMNKGRKRAEAKGPDAELPAPVLRQPTSSVDSLPATHTNSIGMEFVKVPAGTGWLGGGAGRQGETEVKFQDFYLGTYEVTQEEWVAVMGRNLSHFSRDGEGRDVVKNISDADLKRFPVESVSWDECQSFIEQLNKKVKESGWVHRLPTEEEWEYACRGGPVSKQGSAFDFYFVKPTNEPSVRQANLALVKGGGVQRPEKVGEYEKNILGLHDMHGNVWEWCDVTASSPKDPTGLALIAHRGGGWGYELEYCRATGRDARPASYRYKGLGLRVARVPAPVGK